MLTLPRSAFSFQRFSEKLFGSFWSVSINSSDFVEEHQVTPSFLDLDHISGIQLQLYRLNKGPYLYVFLFPLLLLKFALIEQ